MFIIFGRYQITFVGNGYKNHLLALYSLFCFVFLTQSVWGTPT